MSSIDIVLEEPRPEIVERCVKEFNEKVENKITDQAVAAVIKTYPNNTCLCEVLIKVCVINDLFSTRLGGADRVYKAAMKIWEKRQDIDDRLRKGCPGVVEDIATITIDKKETKDSKKNNTQRNYSFATKYCHSHQPDRYWVYDENTSNAVWYYIGKYGFRPKIERKCQIKEYCKYTELLEDFKQHFGLCKSSRRDIDKFLWAEGGKIKKEKERNRIERKAKEKDKP